MFLLFSFLSFCLYIITTAVFLFNKEKRRASVPIEKRIKKRCLPGKGRLIAGKLRIIHYSLFATASLLLQFYSLNPTEEQKKIKKVASPMGGRTKEDLATQNQKHNITPDFNRGSPSLDALIIAFLLPESNHSSEIFLNYSFYKRKKKKEKRCTKVGFPAKEPFMEKWAPVPIMRRIKKDASLHRGGVSRAFNGFCNAAITPDFISVFALIPFDFRPKREI